MESDFLHLAEAGYRFAGSRAALAIDSLDGTAGAQLLAAISVADDAVSLLGCIRRLSELDDRPAERTVLSSGLGLCHAEHVSAWQAKRLISNAAKELGQLRHYLLCLLKALVTKKLTAHNRHIKPGPLCRQQAVT